MLNRDFVPGITETIFPHSKKFEKGYDVDFKREEVIVVALDGTGDFDSIQEALNFLPSAGGEIFIKEGTYNITSTITIPGSFIKIRGAGIGSIISTSLDIVMISSSGKGDLVIDNLYIQGAGNTATTNKGLNLSSLINSKISNCLFTNCGDSAIDIGGTSARCWIFNNRFDSNFAGAIVVNADDSLVSDNIMVGDAAGIFINASSYVSVVGNICKSTTTGDGILIGASSLIIVSNNICNDNNDHGIRIRSSSNCTIVSNICDANNQGGGTDNGIHVQSADAVNSDFNVIASNRCKDNHTEIEIADSDCNKNLVHGNILLGTHTAALTDNGTSTTSADNITS